jgi:hypothetical protein
MRELAAEADAKRIELTAALLSDLGRTPTALDRIAAEAIAATSVRAEMLRRAGRDDSEERRLLAQQMRTSGFRPSPAEPAKPDPGKDLEAIFADIVSERT